MVVLRRHLPPDRPVRVEIEEDYDPLPGPPPGPPYRHGYYARFLGLKGVLVQVQLRDGQVASFSQRLPEEVFDWPYTLLLILLVVLVSVGVSAALAVVG